MNDFPRLGLIGHSHIVALLDALGEWRDQIGPGRGSVRQGFASSFADYHEDSFAGVAVLEDRVSEHKRFSVVAAIPGGSKKQPLATWITKGAKIAISPLLASLCEKLRQCPIIISILYGDEMSYLMYVADMPKYQVAGHVPETFQKGIQPIDKAYIEARAELSVKSVVSVITAMRHLCPSAKFVHVSPPPPVRDPSTLAHQEGMDKLLQQYGTVGPALRLMWYQLQLEMLTNRLTDIVGAVVLPPKEVMDDGGFIKPEFTSGLTHGNAEYGKIMWARILQTVERMGW